MMHGSTVTYRVVVSSGYSRISGVSVLSARMRSIASNSAWRVACGNELGSAAEYARALHFVARWFDFVQMLLFCCLEQIYSPRVLRLSSRLLGPTIISRCSLKNR